MVLSPTLWNVLTFAGIVLGSIIVADVIIFLFDKLVRPLVSKTKTTLDDFLFESLRGPFKFIAFLAGFYLAFQYSAPNITFFDKDVNQLFFLSIIAAGGHAAARMVDALFYWHATQTGTPGKLRISKDVFPLVRKLTKIVLYLIAAIIVLSEFGVEIGPLLAGLGIAGLAVALALQSTLANFFAGLYILGDKPIRVGDRISIDSETGLTGNVEQVGWRTTQIKSFQNVLYIIPNDKLANSTIINYDLAKDKQRTVVLNFGVSYDSELKNVEKALKEVDADLKKMNPNVILEFEPVIRFNGFGDSALNFVFVFQTKTYVDKFQAVHDANALILEKFRKYGIDIPFPIRTVYLNDKKPDKKKK
ncbi:mechanosensitive ion channel family protein [Candidatus Micrarchaeota archaeon]|nr:mechanosensitive ion channel family protein [Candidatus Micrarchaeota archaeon]